MPVTMAAGARPASCEARRRGRQAQHAHAIFGRQPRRPSELLADLVGRKMPFMAEGLDAGGEQRRRTLPSRRSPRGTGRRRNTCEIAQSPSHKAGATVAFLKGRPRVLPPPAPPARVQAITRFCKRGTPAAAGDSPIGSGKRSRRRRAFGAPSSAPRGFASHAEQRIQGPCMAGRCVSAHNIN